MTDEERAWHLWDALNACKLLNGDLTIATVTHWLEYHGVGYPDAPLMQERLRDDARFWSMCATQPELEAYLVACTVEMEKTPVTAKAMKRLAALAWERMKPEDRAKFRDWINSK